MFIASIGPLNRLRLRFAKSTDGLFPAPTPAPNGLGDSGGFAWWLLCEDEAEGMPSLKLSAKGGPRTRRIFDGNEDDVGVLGRTFTEWCGDRPPAMGVLAVETEPLELVELAFECV